MPKNAAEWHTLSVISKQILIVVCEEIAQDVKPSCNHNLTAVCLKRTGMILYAESNPDDECGSLLLPACSWPSNQYFLYACFQYVINFGTNCSPTYASL